MLCSLLAELCQLPSVDYMQKGFLSEEKVREEDEDGEELVTFKHEIRLIHLQRITMGDLSKSM